MVGLMASAAMAQKISGRGFAPIGSYSGIETMPGTLNISNSMRYGNTLVLNGFGEWRSHHLTVSLDFSTNSFNPTDMVITSGSCTLVVVRDNQYMGTLYGKVQTGSVSLITDIDGKEVSKTVQANLTANGGFGIFDGKNIKGMGGVYKTITNSQSKETSGDAIFTF